MMPVSGDRIREILDPVRFQLREGEAMSRFSLRTPPMGGAIHS